MSAGNVSIVLMKLAVVRFGPAFCAAAANASDQLEAVDEKTVGSSLNLVL
jgi:hypothetical protein